MLSTGGSGICFLSEPPNQSLSVDSRDNNRNHQHDKSEAYESCYEQDCRRVTPQREPHVFGCSMINPTLVLCSSYKKAISILHRILRTHFNTAQKNKGIDK